MIFPFLVPIGCRRDARRWISLRVAARSDRFWRPLRPPPTAAGACVRQSEHRAARPQDGCSSKNFCQMAFTPSLSIKARCASMSALVRRDGNGSGRDRADPRALARRWAPGALPPRFAAERGLTLAEQLDVDLGQKQAANQGSMLRSLRIVDPIAFAKRVERVRPGRVATLGDSEEYRRRDRNSAVFRREGPARGSRM